jgi:hypothetical protein
MAYSRISTASKPKDLTLDELVEIIDENRSSIRHSPPQWAADMLRSGLMSQQEYDTIRKTGQRALDASFDVLRNLLLYKKKYSEQDRQSYNVTRRTDLEHLFQSILLYNVYTYYKHAIRTPYYKMGSLSRRIPIKSLGTVSNIESGEVRFPKIENLRPINDELNAIIRMNPELAAVYMIAPGRGAGGSATFPGLTVAIDTDEMGSAEVAEAMEPAIVRAENVLDSIREVWSGKTEYDAAKIDFRTALTALTAKRDITDRVRESISETLRTIGDIPGSVAGAAAVGATLVGPEAAGGSGFFASLLSGAPRSVTEAQMAAAAAGTELRGRPYGYTGAKGGLPPRDRSRGPENRGRTQADYAASRGNPDEEARRLAAENAARNARRETEAAAAALLGLGSNVKKGGARRTRRRHRKVKTHKVKTHKVHRRVRKTRSRRQH